MKFCLLNNRYATRIVMIAFDRGYLISSDMRKLSSAYSNVIETAKSLVEAGILEMSAGEHRSTRWTLTERGNIIACYLCICHYLSHGWIECGEVPEL